MSYKELFKLKTNPFRLTPSLNTQEIVWAGFPKLKEEIKKRILYALKIPNSRLVLNWGEYGSGKTHSAIYFSDKKVLEKIANQVDKPIPYTINLLLPKGKNPVSDFFVSIIDSIDIKKLRNKFQDDIERIEELVFRNSSNKLINNVILNLFKNDISENYLKQYFYGILSNTDVKKNLAKHDILRFLSKDDDYVKFLSLLFTCLTLEQKQYSSVIFWIDEFEDITTLNSSSIDQLNNFLREFINNTPNHLLLFLNFTLSPVDSVEDISKHLSPAVLDRIKSRIEFKQPSPGDLKLYLNDLLNHPKFRVGSVENKFHPFTEESIQSIENELGVVSLRRYNEAFSILLDIAEMEDQEVITADFVNKYKNEFAGWK